MATKLTFKSGTPATSRAADMMVRLEGKIKALGGTIPAPWEWAVVKRRGKKVWVDAALRNLQLLELVEDLQKARK